MRLSPTFAMENSLPCMYTATIVEPIRAASQTGTGAGAAGDFRSPGLRLGCGSAGGLVRGDGRDWRGDTQGVWLLDAIDGQRRRVSCGLLPRHAAGISGSP